MPANADANTPLCDPALIHNSGFETGNFSDWVDVSNGSVPVVTNAIAHSGRFSGFMGGDPSGLAFCGFGTEVPDSWILSESAGACWCYPKLLALGLHC